MLIAVTLPIRNEEAEELIKTYNDKLLDSFKGMLIGADHFSNQTAKRRISGEPDERIKALSSTNLTIHERGKRRPQV